MKKRIADLFTNKKAAVGITALALAVVIGVAGIWQSTSVPELPEHVDAEIVASVSLEEEEPPLASAPKTTTKTTKKTTKKNVKLSKASTKTYTKTLPTTTKTSTKTTKSSTQTVKKQTTVKTAKKEKYTKKSKVKVVTTTVTTTVKTTTTPIAKKTTTTTAAKTTAAAAAKTTATTAKKGKYEVSVTKIAPKMDKKVLSAYQTMGFKVYVDSSVSYAGYFNAKDRSITLREESDNIYHELGHFLAFVSGNTDLTSAFKATYSKEMGKYTGYNKAYVVQSSSEYYAESVRDYTLGASSLKASRPDTYAAITTSLSKVTDAQISKLMKLYAAVWK